MQIDNKEFQTYLLNPQGVEKIGHIAELFDNFLYHLLRKMGDSSPRHVAMVRTKLEEACFLAKKAASLVPENQQGG